MVTEHCPGCGGDHLPNESEELQSVAEAVHLAIKLLEDGLRHPAGVDTPSTEIYWVSRSEAVVDELKPAMMILAPYMPNVISGSNLGEPGVREAPDGPGDEDERGYLDGGDEQAYAKRHA